MKSSCSTFTPAYGSNASDYLFQQQVNGRDAAKYVEEAGGQDAILKLARGHAMPKDIDGDEVAQEDQEEDQEGDEEEEQVEEADPNGMIEMDPTKIFDRETDVAITLTGGELPQILSDDIPLKKPFFLQCKKIFADKHGSVRIVGRLWKPRGK